MNDREVIKQYKKLKRLIYSDKATAKDHQEFYLLDKEMEDRFIWPNR